MDEWSESTGADSPFQRGFGELEELTPGERLLVDRRRRGENQKRAAERLGLTFSNYQTRELDKLDSRDLAPKIETLEANERCFLYRRRAGFTQARVARELGCCRWWLNQMERGVAPVDDLICYWEC